jgi:transcriptional regulator
VLAVNGPSGPLTASIPALLSESGNHLEFHLVRSNPIAEALKEKTDAVFLVNGPDSYVSPDWLGVPDQVPTWNYVSARVEGVATRHSDTDLLPLLDRLSAHFEEQLLPKQPWVSSKMAKDALTRMLRSIVPCSLNVRQIHATWKLSQNKADGVRQRAATELERFGIGQSIEYLADLMRYDE